MVHDSTWAFPYHFASWAVQLLRLKQTFLLLGMGAPCSAEPWSQVASGGKQQTDEIFGKIPSFLCVLVRMTIRAMFIDVLGLGGFMFVYFHFYLGKISMFD